jgi:hypothetical protein
MARPTITHLLIDTATISRLLEVNTGHGRWTKNTVPVSVAIPFRVFTASASDLALGQQLRMSLTHTGYCEPSQDIAKDDIVIITSKNGVPIDQQYMRVMGILDPSILHHRKLALMQITIGEANAS